MGYAWSGICHPDTATALTAFAKAVPSADAAGIISFTAQPTINASGLITWSISHRPLTGTDATTRTGTTQLQACTEGVDQWPVQSLLFIAALFFAAFIGFKSGYRA